MSYWGINRNVTVIHHSDIESFLIENGYGDIWEDIFWDQVRVNNSGEEIFLEPSYIDERLNEAMVLIKNHFEIEGDQFIMWANW